MSGAERCYNQNCTDFNEIHEGACTWKNTVDGEIYVSRVDDSETPLEQVKLERNASLPLFALVRDRDRPSRGLICKLGDGPDAATYSVVAEGHWQTLAEDVIDYLHEGEDALHGPR